MGRYTLSAIERLAKKFVVADNGCWNWTGALQAGGYGTAVVGYKQSTAHRHMYQALRGEIADGLQIDHLCRNRACVNPTHLEPVTQQINILRGEGLAVINKAKTICKNGHEYSEGNTYHRLRRGKPERDCKTCRREAGSRRMMRLQIS